MCNYIYLVVAIFTPAWSKWLLDRHLLHSHISTEKSNWEIGLYMLNDICSSLLSCLTKSQATASLSGLPCPWVKLVNFFCLFVSLKSNGCGGKWSTAFPVWISRGILFIQNLITQIKSWNLASVWINDHLPSIRALWDFHCSLMIRIWAEMPSPKDCLV